MWFVLHFINNKINWNADWIAVVRSLHACLFSSIQPMHSRMEKDRDETVVYCLNGEQHESLHDHKNWIYHLFCCYTTHYLIENRRKKKLLFYLADTFSIFLFFFFLFWWPHFNEEREKYQKFILIESEFASVHF